MTPNEAIEFMREIRDVLIEGTGRVFRLKSKRADEKEVREVLANLFAEVEDKFLNAELLD